MRLLLSFWIACDQAL